MGCALNATYSRPLVSTAASIAGLAAPDSGALAFGALAAATTAATAVTATTATDNRALLEVMNTTDVDVILTVAGVSTNLIIRAGQGKIYDLGPAMKRIDAGSVVGVYRRAAAPASGEVIVQLI